MVEVILVLVRGSAGRWATVYYFCIFLWPVTEGTPETTLVGALTLFWEGVTRPCNGEPSVPRYLTFRQGIIRHLGPRVLSRTLNYTSLHVNRNNSMQESACASVSFPVAYSKGSNPHFPISGSLLPSGRNHRRESGAPFALGSLRGQ